MSWMQRPPKHSSSRSQSLPLPSSTNPPLRFKGLLTRRLRSALTLGAVTLFFVFILTRLHTASVEVVEPKELKEPEDPRYLEPTWPPGTPMPPNFYEWHDREKALPQNNPNLPPPQGRRGKYIWFRNNVKNLGWGNIMQEIVFNAHLAYVTKRIYVFDNYTWDPYSDWMYADYNGKPIPARIPLTAILAGPIAGEPFPPQAGVPPAVIPEFFKEICPEPLVIDREEVNHNLGDASATEIVQAWVDKLATIDDSCVEIERLSAQIFDFWLFGSADRLVGFWPTLIESPIMKHFKWSPLITSAVEANRALIHPAISPGDAHRAPLPGLLALHIRRGDFIDHCMHLANWSAHYMGFNAFPQLPDRFEPPAGGGGGFNTPDGYATYRRHCHPEISEIVERVREVVESPLGKGLDRVYVLTNGKNDWLDELKIELRRVAKWKSISTSRDMSLTPEQKAVGQSIDMLIAQRSDVFIGNGFSSLTSNVVMVRQAQNTSLPWDKIRFW